MRGAGCGGKPAGQNKNRMSLTAFHEFAARLRCLVRREAVHACNTEALGNHEDEFGRLALALFALQFEHNQPWRRFCQSRGASPQGLSRWEDIPAMPTSAFKELQLSVLPVNERKCVFHSSGTTLHRPSRHFHSTESLALYESSLASWFAPHLLPGAAVAPSAGTPRVLLALTPRPSEAPHSSLIHMIDTVARHWRWDRMAFAGCVDETGDWKLELEVAWDFLVHAQGAGVPVMLLGTAFSFVHLLDSLPANRTIQLPPGSRVMETGGYKGRSRAMTRAALHSTLSERLGIPLVNIVSEYGMSELSSQAYDHRCGESSSHVFRFPPWARAQVISPETGREVQDGQTGLIRIFDLANAYSVLAVQTEDLGTKRRDGFELIGRAPRTEPRGCSLLMSPA